MPETPAPDALITDAVLELAGRATLPFQAARADRSFGTAFWYNDLIDVTPGREIIRQYLIASRPRTRYEIGQWTLREELVEAELPADELVMPGFAKKWTALGDLGVAVMPTVELHLHAEKKGWSWATQEITSGLAAQSADIAAIGAVTAGAEESDGSERSGDPEGAAEASGPVGAELTAYVLGHEVVEESGGQVDRPQRLLTGTVTRSGPDAPLHWTGPLPLGFEGAPVFAALPMDDDQLKLLCLGVALPGDPATVVTFDTLRPAIHALAPPRKRHWWQRPQRL